ncbi:DNA (cytosine-5-)-methyltransferase, partial [Staphylococcus epidermidis]
MKYNYIDLFSGAGGMSLGFDLEGFKNVFSVEYDLQTAQTYRYNFPNHVLINKDIQEISTNEIKKIINNNTVDVIIGGPPCQGFSLAGKFGRTFIDDPRNQLFKEYLRFVSILKPKIFIIENVARLVSHNKGKTIREIQESIEKLGYKVKYE